MTIAKSTPMLQQYLAIKGEYPDAILFYRMGDFYEMFLEDAELASGILEITLTSRNKNDPAPIPMCGVPHRAASGYIARLIERGYKVAVCDQVEDPAAAKGLVRREVVRVITPGMIIDEEFLDARTNNFILSVFQTRGVSGLAYLDISTGTFRVTESADSSQILDEARRLSPREILLPESARKNPGEGWVQRASARFADAAFSYVDDQAFDYRRGYGRLTEQLGTLTLEGFGCESFTAGVSAAGALVFYVGDTQKQKTAHLRRLETYWLDRCLVVDEVSRQNLELIRNIRTGTRRGTLLSVLDHTRTAMGARLLAEWLRSPLREAREIEMRLAAVAEGREREGLRRELRERLKDVHDLERLGSKTVMGQAHARDLVALRSSLQALPALWTALIGFSSEAYRPTEPIDELAKLAELIQRGIRDDAPLTLHEGGLIKPGFNPELDDLVRVSSDAKSYLAQLEVREKERTGITSLKVSFNKVFGYYIEVSKSRAGAVPTHYVRKQTLVNAERFITDELKQFETKVMGAEEQRAVLELGLFQEIRDEVVRHHPQILSVARFLARLDCLLNLAEVAAQNGYCRPQILEDGALRIEDGRHPVVEKMITGERFVPNNLEMDNDSQQVLIITGPNMAGKSTVLRQVALSVIMAQMGSFVPARKAGIGIVDRIFTRVGALDNLSQGQSTFMVEMQETANILHNATERSLVIMDEIGRGTSTFDGLSIAWAVAEYLHDLRQKGVKTLFATHYHELTELADRKPRVANLNIAVREWNDEIIFLRKLVPGGTNRSYGIQVARLAGIPAEVIARAKKILLSIENGEHGFAWPDRSPKTARSSPLQLDLFRPTENPVIQKLRELDISRTSPLEALNLLNRLQEMARMESSAGVLPEKNSADSYGKL
jgi:DNA mismatch repair protein MutS